MFSPIEVDGRYKLRQIILLYEIALQAEQLLS